MRLGDRTTLVAFTAFCARRDEIVAPLPPSELKGMSRQAINDHDDDRRRSLANPPIVRTPTVNSFAAELDRLIADNAARAPGDKVHLGFQGIAGIGKTRGVLHAAKTVWNRERAAHGDVVTNGKIKAPRAPVVYSTAPAVKTYKELIGSVLRFFDARATGNAEAMTEQFLHLLQVAETDVVVIDDAHALRGRSRPSLAMADSLKALINRIPCTVVFVGTGFENTVLFGQTVGGYDDPAAQLRHRVVHLEHPSYRRPNRDDPGAFTKLINALEGPISTGLREHRPGTLSSPTTARWLYDQTDGITARVGKWLSAAAVAAVGSDERVTRTLLEQTPAPGLNAA